jgi:hypothetical protein
MRIAADGYIDLRDGRRVRTPGYHDHGVEPVPEAEALSFLLSHSFPGHRRIARSMSIAERKRMRMAMWADSISERMTLMDRVWRGIIEPVSMPKNQDEPFLVQVVQYEHWAYPIYLDGSFTRVIPLGGISIAEVPPELLLRAGRSDGQLAVGPGSAAKAPGPGKGVPTPSMGWASRPGGGVPKGDAPARLRAAILGSFDRHVCVVNGCATTVYREAIHPQDNVGTVRHAPCFQDGTAWGRR